MIKLDGELTIELPGERTRATIRRILSPTKIILELTNTPLAKSHTYKKGEFVSCVKRKTMFGEVWQVLEFQPTLEDFLERLNDKPDTRGNARTDGKDGPKPRSKVNRAT